MRPPRRRRCLQHALAGASPVVADPRSVGLARHADVYLRPCLGTNVALFHGLAYVLVAEGMTDPRFLPPARQGRRITALSPTTPPERVAFSPSSKCPLTPSGKPRPALLARFQRLAVVYGLGVTGNTSTAPTAHAPWRTLLSCAAPRRRHWARIRHQPSRGQNNVQGASDMGAPPDLLPDTAGSLTRRLRARAEEVWGTPSPSGPGLRIPEMFAAAGRALGGHSVDCHRRGRSYTDFDTAGHVAEALDARSACRRQRAFLGDRPHADCRPAQRPWLRRTALSVNFLTVRFQRVAGQPVRPPGTARSDFATSPRGRRGLGADLGCPLRPPPRRVRMPGTAVRRSRTPARLRREPCPGPALAGLARRGHSCTLEESATLTAAPTPSAALPVARAGEEPDDAYPLLLVTGRRWAHGTWQHDRRGATSCLDSHGRPDLHPLDAARYGVRDGAPRPRRQPARQARAARPRGGDLAPDRSSARSTPDDRQRAHVRAR